MIEKIAEVEDQIDLAQELEEEAIWLQTIPLLQEAAEVETLLKDLTQFKIS